MGFLITLRSIARVLIPLALLLAGHLEHVEVSQILKPNNHASLDSLVTEKTF